MSKQSNFEGVVSPMLHPVSTRVQLGILLLVSAAFFSSGSVAHADDGIWQDPTCDEVDQAYLKTRSYPRYSEQIPLIREDGSTKPYIIYVVTESEQRTWRAFDKKWVMAKRKAHSTWDRFLPKFTNCVLMDDDTASKAQEIHYKVIWNYFPYRADADVWISNEDGLLRRFRRHFPDDLWAFSEATIEEVFEYGDPAVLPK
jgi:hypothetical protein